MSLHVLLATIVIILAACAIAIAFAFTACFTVRGGGVCIVAAESPRACPWAYPVLLSCFAQSAERSYVAAYIENKTRLCQCARAGKCYQACAKKVMKKPILVTKVLEDQCELPARNAPDRL